MQNSLAFCAAVMVVGTSLASGPAFAQECTCEISSTATIIGEVLSVSGDVRISQAANFTRAPNGAPLQRGTTIIVGRGATSLSLGNDCRIDLGENSSMTLIPRDGIICAAVRSEPVVASSSNVGAALGIAAGTALVVGGVLLFSQEDEDAPPVSVQ